MPDDIPGFAQGIADVFVSSRLGEAELLLAFLVALLLFVFLLRGARPGLRAPRRIGQPPPHVRSGPRNGAGRTAKVLPRCCSSAAHARAEAGGPLPADRRHAPPLPRRLLARHGRRSGLDRLSRPRNRASRARVRCPSPSMSTAEVRRRPSRVGLTASGWQELRPSPAARRRRLDHDSASTGVPRRGAQTRPAAGAPRRDAARAPHLLNRRPA